MYFRVAVTSIALLLISRLLGLARESVQAFAFGTTAVADLVVVMLTLPDVTSALLVGGALSYALLPWWGRQTPSAMAASQKRVSLFLLGLGAVITLWVMLMPQLLGGWLAPGVGEGMQPMVSMGLRWASLSIPVALLTLVWYTRLQHERDAVGMYGMNVVHTSIIIAAMAAAAGLAMEQHAITVLGLGLLLAFGMRLAFLQWRLMRLVPSNHVPDVPVQGLPPTRFWLWALFATAAPVAVPLLARSLVSSSGEGALSTFNYAWKLVELPNQLAIQVVTTLAFPALTRAYSAGREFVVQLRAAFMLSWTLACAAALGLWFGALPCSSLLFGWGRMEAGQVEKIAHWAGLGAWTLLPQSLISVVVLVLATTGRLAFAALAYLAALAALAAIGVQHGSTMMVALTVALVMVAALLMWVARGHVANALAWREMAIPAVVTMSLAVLAPMSHGFGHTTTLVLAVSATLTVLGLSFAASPVLRMALKR